MSEIDEPVDNNDETYSDVSYDDSNDDTYNTDSGEDNPTSTESSSSSDSSSDDSYTDSSGGSYVGSVNSNKFHYPSCGQAGKIKSENLITFSSRDDAISRGYSPCSFCNP